MKAHALAAIALSLTASVSSSFATVTNINTVNVGNKTNLVDVSLSDGRLFTLGRNIVGVDLFHFRGTSNSSTIMSPDSSATINLSSTKSDLLEDAALNTGVINPGRSAAGNAGLTAGTSPTTTTNGIGLNFLQPVLNGPGEDVLIVEFASDSGQAGDPIVVSGLVGGTGFSAVSSGHAFVTTYEFSKLMSATTSHNQTLPVTDLLDLDTSSVVTATSFSAPFLRAVAIDLSGLGVAPGAYATGLWIQAQSSGAEIDTVFIGGLIDIPEPATAGLALLGLATLMRRRQRA